MRRQNLIQRIQPTRHAVDLPHAMNAPHRVCYMLQIYQMYCILPHSLHTIDIAQALYAPHAPHNIDIPHTLHALDA